MASGYPDTPNRTAYGPTYLDKRPVLDPAKEPSAALMNLIAWQLAGASATVARAVIIFDPTLNAGLGGITYQSLAWDSNGTGSAVPFVIQGVGDYDFNFAATYPDQNDVETQFIVRAAMAFGQNAASQVQATTQVRVDSPQQVTVNVGDEAGAVTDATVIVQVW